MKRGIVVTAAAALALAALVASIRTFRPEADKRGCTADRLYVSLASKSGADVGTLAFGVERATYDIVEATVTDPLGNVTTLGFSDVARNVDVPDATFEFSVPPGVDVITPPGAATPPPS